MTQMIPVIIINRTKITINYFYYLNISKFLHNSFHLIKKGEGELRGQYLGKEINFKCIYIFYAYFKGYTLCRIKITLIILFMCTIYPCSLLLLLLLSRFSRVWPWATPQTEAHQFPLSPGILQARTLEWVAISFSNACKWKVKGKSLNAVRLLATPWTAAYQAPPSMGISRQEYWSGVPLPYPPCSLAYIKYFVPLIPHHYTAPPSPLIATSLFSVSVCLLLCYIPICYTF